MLKLFRQISFDIDGIHILLEPDGHIKRASNPTIRPKSACRTFLYSTTCDWNERWNLRLGRLRWSSHAEFRCPVEIVLTWLGLTRAHDSQHLSRLYFALAD